MTTEWSLSCNIGLGIANRGVIQEGSNLLDSDRQYRELAELNPDAFIIQVEGKVVYCNQSARRKRVYQFTKAMGADAGKDS